jgi:tight adherence protein C
LGRKRTARLHAAERELPLFLDLLASSVFAGLSGPLAVRAAVAVSEGPLAEEFARALAAVDLGARWRDELTSVGDRIASADLHRAIGILARSDALGASLSERLAEVATDARESRRSVTMERARRAPVKMLFPLVFLILPSFLLLTVVPVLLTTIRSIR